MADSPRVEDRVRSYMVDHGGTLDDGGGRVDTDKMAAAVGADSAHHLRTVLGQLEQDGVISREMQGARTRRITLITAGAAPANGADAPPATTPEPPAAEPPTAEPPTADAPAAEAPAAEAPVAAPEPAAPAPPADRALSLREAIALQKTLAEQAPAAAATSTPALIAAPAAVTEPGGARRWRRDRGPTATPEAVPNRDDISIGDARTDTDGDDTGERVPRGVLMPEMNAPPSNKVLLIVGVAMAVLVLIAVITVLANNKTPHAVPLLDTAAASVDACNVVTTQMATVAFGDNAGPPHFVLGECVYDDGTHELIAEVDRIDAKKLFDASRTPSAQRFPGIGDGAYYVSGSLWALKGSSLIQLTLGPVPAASPPPQLLTVGATAAARLTAP